MATPVFYGWKIVIVCFLIALFSFGIGFYGLGIYRKQGRKPARSAAAAVGKKTTLRDLAGFTGQVGRQ